nr:TonB-dependent receptor [Acidobacteriota bacterium]
LGNPFYAATFPGGRYYQTTENFVFQDNLTWVRNRHSFKTGYELIRTRGDDLLSTLPGGVFRFGGTDSPFTPNTGNDFAAFLLGSVTRADFTTELANWLPRWFSHALYFQDDWTVNRRLTLNLGVRWSYETPFQTKYGQQSEFNPSVTDALTGLPGAITHPTGPLARNDLNNFQPRIGLAYKINDKMVFRGGFGLTTIDLYTAALDQNFEEYTTTASVQRPSGDPRPAFFLSQGPGTLPNNIQQNGTSPFVGVNYSARNATWYDPKMRAPYAMNWNGTYQYEFAPNLLLELSYQGSAGVGLLNAWDINTIPLNISSDRATLDQIYSNQQAYRPYPQFGQVALWSNFGHSTFHSGTVKVEKRYSKGLTLTGFFTKSKAIDESDADSIATGETYYNRRLEKGRAGFDVANRFVTYATYELPVGKGRQFMSSGGFKDYLLGGWNLSFVQTLQSGVPVTFLIANSPNKYLPGVLRPNEVLPIDQVNVQDWRIGDRFNNSLKNPIWNINAFSYPAPYTAGTLGRNTLEGPGLIWSQGSLAKNMKFGEKYNMDVRFDINNIFKRPNFANPNSTVNLGSPGTFGKPTSTIGGFCCLGGQFVGTLVLKFWF